MDSSMQPWEVLRAHQRQLDPHGEEVGVSRQALDETLDYIQSLQQSLDRLEAFAEQVQETGQAPAIAEDEPVLTWWHMVYLAAIQGGKDEIAASYIADKSIKHDPGRG